MSQILLRFLPPASVTFHYCLLSSILFLINTCLLCRTDQSSRQSQPCILDHLTLSKQLSLIDPPSHQTNNCHPPIRFFSIHDRLTNPIRILPLNSQALSKGFHTLSIFDHDTFHHPKHRLHSQFDKHDPIAINSKPHVSSGGKASRKLQFTAYLRPATIFETQGVVQRRKHSSTNIRLPISRHHHDESPSIATSIAMA